MCELCSGEFEEIATIEVGRAAFLRQHVSDFGAFHAVVEDANVEDQHILSAIAADDATPYEKEFGLAFLRLTEEERISALALAANLWGADAVPYREMMHG